MLPKGSPLSLCDEFLRESACWRSRKRVQRALDLRQPADNFGEGQSTSVRRWASYCLRPPEAGRPHFCFFLARGEESREATLPMPKERNAFPAASSNGAGFQAI